MMSLTDGLIAFLSAVLGTFGFAVMLKAPRRSWIPVCLLSGVGYLLHALLTALGVRLAVAMLVAATVTSFGACILSLHLKMINTVYLTLSIVPFVPGLGLYQCMSLLGSDRNAEGLAAGIEAMTSIIMIVLGISVGCFLFQITRKLQKRMKRRGNHAA